MSSSNFALTFSSRTHWSNNDGQTLKHENEMIHLLMTSVVLASTGDEKYVRVKKKSPDETGLFCLKEVDNSYA